MLTSRPDDISRMDSWAHIGAIGGCFKHLIKYPANERSHSLMLHLLFKYGGVDAKPGPFWIPAESCTRKKHFETHRLTGSSGLLLTMKKGYKPMTKEWKKSGKDMKMCSY